MVLDLKIAPSGQTIVKPTALGPVANTDTKLLIYGLFQSGRVLAQDGVFTFFATGTKWRQNEYRYHYYYAYMPQARVVERNGRYYLEVDGVGVSVEVVREW